MKDDAKWVPFNSFMSWNYRWWCFCLFTMTIFIEVFLISHIPVLLSISEWDGSLLLIILDWQQNRQIKKIAKYLRRSEKRSERSRSHHDRSSSDDDRHAGKSGWLAQFAIYRSSYHKPLYCHYFFQKGEIGVLLRHLMGDIISIDIGNTDVTHQRTLVTDRASVSQKNAVRKKKMMFHFSWWMHPFVLRWRNGKGKNALMRNIVVDESMLEFLVIISRV